MEVLTGGAKGHCFGVGVALEHFEDGLRELGDAGVGHVDYLYWGAC